MLMCPTTFMNCKNLLLAVTISNIVFTFFFLRLLRQVLAIVI